VSENPTQDLDYWVNRLSSQEMPIFAHTAQHITGVVARNDSSVAELSRGILQDASMTARLLRLANSIYYNPHACHINTITRAVMVLGFDAVRSMCVSFTLIETMLRGAQRERAYQQMARSFHAAVQAKKLATVARDDSPEEIFIAALLFRLGHIAFWCFAGELVERLETAMLKPGYTEGMAEQEVLGFRLQQLTQRLSEEWQLSKLLVNALESKSGGDSRINHIILGHKVAQVAELGWDTPEAERVIHKVSGALKMAPAAATAMLQSTAREAAAIIEQYGGARKFRRLIPVPPEAEDETGANQPTEVSPYPQPDRLLQFKILHELSTLLLNKQLDINLLFSILLEGIFRGVGMDRVLLAILTADRRYLKGKFGLGWAKPDLVQNLMVDVIPRYPNIFSYALEKRQPLWVQVDSPAEISRLVTREGSTLIGRPPFFLMAIGVKDRTIGVIYADRQASGRALDEESFTSFKYFCQQADVNLTYVAG
jgi:HD-like signal output (HDOD) protein